MNGRVFNKKMDKFENKIWESKCERTIKHYWEKQGVIGSPTNIGMVWKCSNCQKVFVQELEEIEIDDEFKRDFPEHLFVEKGIKYILKTKKGKEIYQQYGKSFRNILTNLGLIIWNKAQEELKQKGE